MKLATVRPTTTVVAIGVTPGLLELAAYAPIDHDDKIPRVLAVPPAPGRGTVKPMAPDGCAGFATSSANGDPDTMLASAQVPVTP